MTIKKIISVMLACVMIAAMTFYVAAAAEPVAGGKTVFTAADFKIDYDSVKGNGAFKAYRIDMSVVKLDGKEVVKMKEEYYAEELPKYKAEKAAKK